MKLTASLCALLILLPLTAAAQTAPPASSSPGPATGSAGILQPQELADTVPVTVYFSGKVATVQLRNSGGVRSPAGKLTEFTLVDTSGYSSGTRERYQFYVLTDVPFEVAGKRLPAGAYAGGFVKSGAIFMDLGGTELFTVPLSHDPDLRRPRPLQVLSAPSGSGYRLYLGRDFVSFRQLP